MLFIPSPPVRSDRRPLKMRRVRVPPPPLAVELVAASIIGGGTFIELTFNQPIDIEQIQAYDLYVNAPHLFEWQLQGTGGAVLVGAATVRVPLIGNDTPAGTDTILTALQPTGILSIDETREWDGVDALTLPFNT